MRITTVKTKLSLSERWRQHVDSWKDCECCPLYLNRTQVVLARGDLPCDILLVGMAPGRSEDVIGKPFVGPAGKLQDSITSEAFYGLSVRHAYINLVCCLPIGDDGGIRDPEAGEIKACSDRLLEAVDLFQPRLLVAVGSVARTWLPNLIESYEIVTVEHPSSILRAKFVQRGSLIQRAVVVLRTAAEKFATQSLLNKEGRSHVSA